MAKESKPSASAELLARMSNTLPEATAELRAQMADPGLMKSKAYVPPKNSVNPEGSDLPPGVPGA